MLRAAAALLVVVSLCAAATAHGESVNVSYNIDADMCCDKCSGRGPLWAWGCNTQPLKRFSQAKVSLRVMCFGTGCLDAGSPCQQASSGGQNCKVVSGGKYTGLSSNTSCGDVRCDVGIGCVCGSVNTNVKVDKFSMVALPNKTAHFFGGESFNWAPDMHSSNNKSRTFYLDFSISTPSEEGSGAIFTASTSVGSQAVAYEPPYSFSIPLFNKQGSRTPYYTVLVSLQDGLAKQVQWNFNDKSSQCGSCIDNTDVDKPVCLESKNGDGSCSLPRTFCEKPENADRCAASVYVAWQGTDVNGDYCISRNEMFSQFTKMGVGNMASQLYDDAAGFAGSVKSALGV